MKKRAYTQKRRREATDETRSRIVDATMQLHEELGPRNASISAIADRAGVQRLTVYRHFADDEALFAACTSRWLALHPPPDPAGWVDVADAREKTQRALRSLYAYYRATERMWRVSHRDVDEVPAMQAPMAAFRGYTESVADDLAATWSGRGRPSAAIRATLRHAVSFATWASLAEEGLDDRRAAKLVLAWLDGAGNVR